MNIKLGIFQISLLILLWTNTSCNAQLKSTSVKFVGGPCEGCEAIFEFGNEILAAIDTLLGFENNEPKLKIYGTVFKKDGKHLLKMSFSTFTTPTDKEFRKRRAMKQGGQKGTGLYEVG